MRPALLRPRRRVDRVVLEYDTAAWRSRPQSATTRHYPEARSSETILAVWSTFGDAEGGTDDKSDTCTTRRRPARGGGIRRTRLRAPRRRSLRCQENVELEGKLTRVDFVNPHTQYLFQCRRQRRGGHRDEIRDASGHGASTLGLVAGDVRAGRVHRALAAAQRRKIRQPRETACPAGERQAEPRRGLGAGAAGLGPAVCRRFGTSAGSTVTRANHVRNSARHGRNLPQDANRPLEGDSTKEYSRWAATTHVW
jgi:hypothetical protein